MSASRSIRLTVIVTVTAPGARRLRCRVTVRGQR